MCVVKTPKVSASEQKPKDPIVIRNPYLDGTGPQMKALRMGRSSLRIERAGARAPSAPPASVLPPTQGPLPVASAPLVPGTSVRGGGGSGGGFGLYDSLRINAY
jgi:hypothetical protein